ncbi:MAG: YjjG family noncanonical pyrimidine nucleotidase [Caldilineales bacterium]
MPPYTWLIFDADGTLFDYDRAEAAAFRRTFDQNGHPFAPEYADVYREVNGQIWREFEQGEITADDLRIERFARLFKRLDLDTDPAAFSRDYLLNLGRQAGLIDGAAEVVAALHDYYRMIVLTNGLRDVQRSRLAGCGLQHFFTDIVISDEVGVAKPDPAIFDIAFERMGNPPRGQVLMIGDGLSSDIRGAANYGIDACWFNPAGGRRPSGLPIRYEIDRLASLLPLLSTD